MTRRSLVYADSEAFAGIQRRRAEQIMEGSGNRVTAKRFLVRAKGAYPVFLHHKFSEMNGRPVTFDLIVDREHARLIRKSNKWNSTNDNSIGHLSISVAGRHAVITELQGTAVPEKFQVPEAVRDQYAGWHEALIETVKNYCREMGLQLWMFHESEYDPGNYHYQADGKRVNVPSKYSPFRKKYAAGTMEKDPITGALSAYRVSLEPGAPSRLARTGVVKVAFLQGRKGAGHEVAPAFLKHLTRHQMTNYAVDAASVGADLSETHHVVAFTPIEAQTALKQCLPGVVHTVNIGSSGWMDKLEEKVRRPKANKQQAKPPISTG